MVALYEFEALIQKLAFCPIVSSFGDNGIAQAASLLMNHSLNKAMLYSNTRCDGAKTDTIFGIGIADILRSRSNSNRQNVLASVICRKCF